MGRKLAGSGCRVAAFDLFFDLPQTDFPRSDDLVGAIRELRAEGVHCVLGCYEWQDVPQSMSRAMTEPGVTLGAVWLNTQRGPVAARDRDDEETSRPALVLVERRCRMAAQGERAFFDFGETTPAVRIKHEKAADTAPRSDPDPILVNRIVPGDDPDVSHPAEDSPDIYTPQDQIAIMYLPKLPSDETFKAATIDAGVLMSMDRAELRRWCKDKVVVLANHHTDHTGEFAATPDGRLLPTSLGHALCH